MSVLLVKTTAELTALEGTATAGDTYFNSDTKNILVWDSSAWRGYASDGNSIPFISNSFSASFNGSSDYLNAGQISTLAGATQQTVSFWFKAASAGIFPNWGFRVHSQNLFAGRGVGTVGSADYWFEARNGSGEVDEFRYVIANADLPSDTNWHHYVLIFDAGSPSVYIDGVQKTGTPAKTPPTSLNSTTGNFSVGRLGDTTSLYSAGSFDEFAMWDVALDSSNAAQLYNLGRPFDLSTDAADYNKSADLTHWWRMGDDASDTDSGGGSPTNGDAVGNVENAANNNTNDASVGGGSPTYSSSTPS